jgi:hypothetical protein
VEQYSHTLIAGPKDFIPVAMQVQDFLTLMVSLGVVPEPATATLRTPSARIRQAMNPFTGELVVMRMKDHKQLASTAQICEALTELRDFEIEVAGEGRPRIPPIPIDFDQPYLTLDQPYFVGVTCIVSCILRSTSSFDYDSPHEENLIGYGEPCGLDASIGHFTNPWTAEPIQVPEAGCARFWIQFELGKFLFPRLDDNNLEILHPKIAEEASRTFGISFVQGCYCC